MLDELMDEFCDIVMPKHKHAKGYINVREMARAMGVNERTYYNWKHKDSVPNIRTMQRLLNERGYELSIRPKSVY